MKPSGIGRVSLKGLKQYETARASASTTEIEGEGAPLKEEGKGRRARTGAEGQRGEHAGQRPRSKATIRTILSGWVGREVELWSHGGNIRTCARSCLGGGSELTQKS